MNYGTLDEKKALGAKSGWWCAGGILLVIVSVVALGAVAGRNGSDAGAAGLVILFALLRLAGAALWVVGCGFYAKSKGYSPAMGLLGLLSIVGLIILVVLPDKWNQALQYSARPMGPSDMTNYPR